MAAGKGREAMAVPPRREALRDGVYKAILTALVEQHLEPGTPLRIDTFAKELNVSPTPVREALVHLEATGLVTRTALKGYAVAPPLSPEDMSNLTTVRALIEPEAARSACALHGHSLGKQLGDALDRQRRASVKGRAGFRNYVAADSDFHSIIFEHCDNRFLQQCSGILEGQMHRLRVFRDDFVTDAEQAIAEHRAILDAFLADDPKGAEDAMRKHLAGVRERTRADQTVPATA